MLFEIGLFLRLIRFGLGLAASPRYCVNAVVLLATIDTVVTRLLAVASRLSRSAEQTGGSHWRRLRSWSLDHLVSGRWGLPGRVSVCGCFGGSFRLGPNGASAALLLALSNRVLEGTLARRCLSSGECRLRKCGILVAVLLVRRILLLLLLLVPLQQLGRDTGRNRLTLR